MRWKLQGAKGGSTRDGGSLQDQDMGGGGSIAPV